jgi:membrane protease YdiL (CAAX protease family)
MALPRETRYFLATRHPWPCLLFLLPLLVAYEAGVVWLGGAGAEGLRNGADAWLRWLLESFGLRQLYWAPALLAVVFAGWSWLRRDDRPQDLPGTLIGMGIESVAYALALWGLGQGMAPFLARLAVNLSIPASPEAAVGQVVTFVGAGIYEETVFRLVLFAGLCRLLRLAEAPLLVAAGFAALASAALFSAAHHLGPYGEAFSSTVFLFRLLAGLYFALLFQLRGFGIAVGAHACYDVLVGVSVG